ncbi:MAG: alpha/beta fold hydrolase [Patescibacteria group bacterium]
MKKRVFIIHGWEGNSKNHWFPWLKKELEKADFEVIVPDMPNTDEPKIEEWVPFLADLVGEPDENTYFVGHSIGCQAISRYLEILENKKVGGAIFAAGWFHLINLEGPEEEKIVESWIKTKIDLRKVKDAANIFIAIFSDNDEWVPLSDKDIFEKELGAEIIVEHNKNHFDGIKELPIVLESILRMSK